MNKRGAYQKRARNVENIEARHALLIKKIISPDKVSRVLAESIICQRKFAALTIPGTNITSIALNTMKSLANQIFATQSEGYAGFEYFDNLRLQLKKILDVRANGHSSRSEEAKANRKEQKNIDYETKLKHVEMQNTLRAKAYLDLYGKINALIKEGDIEQTTKFRIFNILENHHSLYDNLFDPQGARAAGEEPAFTLITGGKER